MESRIHNTMIIAPTYMIKYIYDNEQYNPEQVFETLYHFGDTFFFKQYGKGIIICISMPENNVFFVSQNSKFQIAYVVMGQNFSNLKKTRMVLTEKSIFRDWLKKN